MKRTQATQQSVCIEKMTYDAATGTVICRSRMHLGLKRNFQVMPGAQWLELRCQHIADRYEHLGLWQPQASERSPPMPPGAWPVNSVLPMTYHALRDIA